MAGPIDRQEIRSMNFGRAVRDFEMASVFRSRTCSCGIPLQLCFSSPSQLSHGGSAPNSSVVQRHGRLRTRSDHEDMIRVEPVENPDVVPRHPSHVRPPRHEARLVVPWTRKCFRVLERADGCEYSSIRRCLRPHPDSRERAAKGGAQPRDSSGQGDSPVSIARLSCSGVRSM
jgi:hypothetical protein